MPKEDPGPSTPSIPTVTAIDQTVRILKANYVEVPLAPEVPSPDAEEFLKLRAAFFAGEKLSPEQLQVMMLRSIESETPPNSNCYIC